MPEIPDLTVYVEHLDQRVTGRTLRDIRIVSPFLLRSVSPTVDDLTGHRITGVRRLAKQIVLELADDLFAVLHLMIAGRLRWYDEAKPVPKRNGLAAFDFDNGTLILTEASRKRRASLRLVKGRVELAALDPGGLEVFDIDFDAFFERLKSTPHTVKRALTDQRVFAGIGNAYSDEILFEAGMSPFKLGRHMTPAEARKPVRHLSRCTHPLGGHAARTGGWHVSHQGHGLPSEHGRARQVSRALRGLRSARPAHPEIGERVQLLRPLPDRRPVAGGPFPVAVAQGHLSETDRGLGGPAVGAKLAVTRAEAP